MAIILKLTSRPSLSLLLRSTFLQYLGPSVLLRTHVLTYFFMISRTKYTKNILVGSPAVLVRDEIHCNKYPGTRRVMNIGYPGSKISTRFNPSMMDPSLVLLTKASLNCICSTKSCMSWYVLSSFLLPSANVPSGNSIVTANTTNTNNFDVYVTF